MNVIYSYQKFIDAQRSVEIRFPEDENHQRIGEEIATIEGTTYVCLPSDAILPTQPVEINVVAVEVTPELKAALRAASPKVRWINDQVRMKIESVYSVSDEIKLLRTAPSAEFEAYNEFAENCRAWGRAEKAKLGL
jgi:hypothetical protein